MDEEKYRTTILFEDKAIFQRLKCLAVMQGVAIGELLNQMVDQELETITKTEAAGILSDHSRCDELLAVK